jgi:hypothetical protein
MFEISLGTFVAAFVSNAGFNWLGEPLHLADHVRRRGRPTYSVPK